MKLNPTRTQLKKLIATAKGDQTPDFVIKNVTILDLVNGDERVSNVALSDHWIAGIHDSYDGPNTMDATGLTIVPGLIDSHTHIESSMMHPFEFESLTLPKGTTTIICDPHEITNVMGLEGIEWILRCAEKMTLRMLVQVSSCVPSLPGFETNGGRFTLDEMRTLMDHPFAFGLAEMMNLPGVIFRDETVLDKLEVFANAGRPLDGHAPLARGKVLNAYRSAGIQNCHESVGREEALEKLSAGMAVMLREGSVAKNLNTLAPIVHAFNSHQCLICTDDRNPFEIYNEGHLDFIVRTLINKHGMKPHMAYRLSSYSAAQHYGLKRLGLIGPGYRADFLLLSDVNQVAIEQVYMGGERVDFQAIKNNIGNKLKESSPPLRNSIVRKEVSPQDFEIQFTADRYNVIEVIPGEIITHHRIAGCRQGELLEKDINIIAVLERYGNNLPPALGLVKGFDLTSGAIASSVAHDSHNIIVVGANASDMALAANTLRECGGGFTVVKDGKVLATAPLPIAGLISLNTAEEISQQIIALKKACKELGCNLHEPFLQMAFLALPVIPTLKITDKGLVDTDKLEFITLEA